MDSTVEEATLHPDLKCSVCGENQFEERDGFYYCQECGTKQESVRQVEIEKEDFDPQKEKARKQKIHVPKVEKPQLTSWECYNYILRGYVEDLLSFGAKEELKLMTLQVWAAYLRRMEVAFFNRKQMDLPKLGIKYLQNDATAIYNHSKEIRKKRKRKRSEDTSCTSGNESTSRKDFNRSKRKLDESNYSQSSIMSGFSGLTSSRSANSNRAIKIEFNAKAMSFFKRNMPRKHIQKHQTDAEGLLTCHKQPTARQIKRRDYHMIINIKQVYCILAIALNLIGDDIQLCDLIRFINEGHIGTSNVLQYFPDNIATNGKEILNKINFYRCREKYNEKFLRESIAMLCKHIGIRQLKNPDLVKLVQRYVTELCLPSNVSDYIERLINLLPPNFNVRVLGTYPAFEARAMAYIIFTLKLFFGLDDCKEYRISSASKQINSKIDKLNGRSQESKPLLFVWSEWAEYIEMRKVIISQFNSSFCQQYMQSQSTDQVIEQWAEEMRRTEERNNLFNDTTENLNFTEKLKNLKTIFGRFLETAIQSNELPTSIEFQPSFTPGVSYLKNIFLLCDNNINNKKSSSTNIKIPDFMRIVHSERDINSYLQVKPLIEYFKTHQMNLNVHVLATKENKRYVGIFRHPNKCKNEVLFKACFKVTEEEWSEAIISDVNENLDDLEFITKKKSNSSHDSTMIQDTSNDEADNENIRKSRRNSSQLKTSLNGEDTEELQSMHSFQLFSEDNMEPVNNTNFLAKPRRNLDNIDLFEGISDEESVLNNDDVDTYISDHSSHMASNNNNDSILSPTRCEEFIKVEPASPKKLKKQNNKLSRSNDDILKMYISNMDCWMILGSFPKTTKIQRSQLQDRLPRSFNWLLETCAQTINVEWSAVFEQLLCIETMFCLGISNTETIKNCVYLNSCNSSKEIQKIVGFYRDIW